MDLAARVAQVKELLSLEALDLGQCFIMFIVWCFYFDLFFLQRIHVLPSVQLSSGLVLSPVALSLHGEGFDVPELRPCFSAGMALGAAQE